MNDAGAVTGAAIGLVWLVLGWWMIRLGASRNRAAAGWDRAAGTIVERDGRTDGVIARHPHVRYAGPDGTERIAPSGSRGGVWEPGTPVEVLLDPGDPDRIMLAQRAERGQPYQVVGWFLVVVAILTFVGSALLAFSPPA